MRARLLAAAALLAPALARSQTVTIDSTTKFQTIDGFGTFAGAEANQAWWQSLFFDDLGASIARMDLTPPFVAPYSNQSYCSPWYGQTGALAINDGGPDGTYTRPYTSATDYSSAFGGCAAPIAVFGDDAGANASLLNLSDGGPEANPGLIAQLGQARGDFKLYASLWSPAPWLKITSGNKYGASTPPSPADGTPWPFIWGGNFAGGMLDTSGTALAAFNDGTEDTSALTQFGRQLAAFLHGFQKTYGVSFYAISIQNELSFEEFYNSATYPQASQYIAALLAARAELDQHADLAAIRIIGPEDLLGGDPYSLWEYGSGSTGTTKNLQYLQAVAADPDAGAALAGFAIHGYDSNGVTAAGSSSTQWQAWAQGWTTSPAAGIPASVAGFQSYGKPSWMTETSGEDTSWLSSSSGAAGGDGGFPDQGGFSIAVKIHQALTAGMESAWLYWQLTDGSPSAPSTQALTDATSQANAPKYNAAKHFFKYIRPGAQRVAATVSGSTTVLASAYLLGSSLTAVLINESPTAATVSVALPTATGPFASLSTYTSSNGSYWQSGIAAVTSAAAAISVPGYGVVTITGTGASSPPDAGSTTDAGGREADAGISPSDAGSTVVADAGVNAGTDGGSGTAAAEGTGCGCQTAPGVELAFLLALAWLTLLPRRVPARLRKHR